MTPRKGPKEKAYDAEIAPLMTQIIAISKRAGIPMHASFALDGDLACTTHIVEASMHADPEWAAPYDHLARRAHGGSSLAFINTRDASGRIIRSEAVIG